MPAGYGTASHGAAMKLKPQRQGDSHAHVERPSECSNTDLQATQLVPHYVHVKARRIFRQNPENHKATNSTQTFQKNYKQQFEGKLKDGH